jgi:maltose alpha-D-glucosyltransferase / alpha-amylase
MTRPPRLQGDPTWHKDAILYRVRVRSFKDGNGDGIGDLVGLAEKLEHVEDLGATAILLAPFFPSPLRDDGYDVTDPTDVHPDCGTLQDFKALVREAHARDLRVVVPIVVGHTSEAHPDFQRARRAAAGSPARERYVFADVPPAAPERARAGGVLCEGRELSGWSWDGVARGAYAHRLHPHEPDLNLASAAVRRTLLRVVDFWLGHEVDGLSLVGLPELRGARGAPGSDERLEGTHALVREIRAHLEERWPDRLLLVDAHPWPEAPEAFVSSGEEAHLAFDPDLAPRLRLAIRTEDRFPVEALLVRAPAGERAGGLVLGLGVRDELALAAGEAGRAEKDFLLRAFAREPRGAALAGVQRRLAPFLDGERAAIELFYGLLLSLPGVPEISYGDEIGMGDDLHLGDAGGARTPMRWTGDTGAGFSTAPAPLLAEPPLGAASVEEQRQDQCSLLSAVKRLVALRRVHPALSRGAVLPLEPDNKKVAAFVRTHGDESVLVVANLSRFVQAARIELPGHLGLVPVELAGRSELPAIGEGGATVTLGPRGLYWLALERPRKAAAPVAPEGAPPAERKALRVPSVSRSLLLREGRRALEEALPAFLRRSRWFAGKARTIRSATLFEALPVPFGDREGFVAVAEVVYMDGESEAYVLPLAVSLGGRAREIRATLAHFALADLQVGARAAATPGVVHDALVEEAFLLALLDLFRSGHRLRGSAGEVHTVLIHPFDSRLGGERGGRTARLIKGEQSNSCMVFGEKVILKLFRRLEEGLSIDLEMGRFLTERCSFPHAPRLVGWLGYERKSGEQTALAVLQDFVPNRGDAWKFTLEELGRYYERSLAESRGDAGSSSGAVPPRPASLFDGEPPPAARRRVGAYLEAARLLGVRVAELHLALGSDATDPAFAPEPTTARDQASMVQSLRSLMKRVFRLLSQNLRHLPASIQPGAKALLGEKRLVAAQFDAFRERPMPVPRIRCHGDLHLGQMLYTGDNFVFIDFEGEPARPLAERRRKRAGLLDVAGMIRSFHYAAAIALSERLERGGPVTPRSRAVLEGAARLWQTSTSATFLVGYVQKMGDSPLIPHDRRDLRVLLSAFLLEKAIYELGYELQSRPAWVWIPLQGIRQILGKS